MSLGTVYDNTLTPATLNVEETVVIDQTNGLYIVSVDLAALAAAETVEFRPYLKARSGGTRRLAMAAVVYDGVLAVPIVPSVFGDAIPALYYFELTIKQVDGTLRAIPIVVSKIA